MFALRLIFMSQIFHGSQVIGRSLLNLILDFHFQVLEKSDELGKLLETSQNFLPNFKN